MMTSDIRLPPGFRLFHYESIGSTNDAAKRLAHDGAAAGTMVWADSQNAGRGRRGREWMSPPGNLYVSLLWRPDCPIGQAAQLGFVAALAVADALPALPSLRYKWPNDVLLCGRKLAGILLESETTGGTLADFVVIGIGVNLSSSPEGTETAATSLAEHGLAVAPAAIVAGLAAGFALWQGVWRREGFAPIRSAWLRRAGGVGEDIRVRLDRSTLYGKFRDLDEGGALVLEQASGLRRIAAGDIFPAAGW